MRIAAIVGGRLRGGEVIQLISDLGGGKTTFTRGLVVGSGSTDIVASPSFTVSREYQAGALTIQHFDFYRLDEPGVMANELSEIIGDPHTVTVVEWADIVNAILPEGRLTVTITITGPDQRQLNFSGPTECSYLLDGLKS